MQGKYLTLKSLIEIRNKTMQYIEKINIEYKDNFDRY